MIASDGGAQNIYGAEFNLQMYDVLMKDFTNYTGNIGNCSNVHMYNAEGRFFIRSSQRKYDMLIFDNAIAIAAVQSGAFTLAEGYLYTVEAIEDYIRHLEDGGILFLSNPFSDHDRFICIIREAFRKLGRTADFPYSIFVADNESKAYEKCKILVKNGRFTKEEIQALNAYADENKHKVIYAPYSQYQTYGCKSNYYR